jgi:hypothetical protein
MGQPRNPHVHLLFDLPADRAQIAALGIDPDDAFVFAYAKVVPEVAPCPQIRTAVLTKTEAEFDRLLPVAREKGLKIPDAVVLHVADPGVVHLEDCCINSRDVQVIALAAPLNASKENLESIEKTKYFLHIDPDGNPDRAKRHMHNLGLSPTDGNIDCPNNLL